MYMEPQSSYHAVLMPLGLHSTCCYERMYLSNNCPVALVNSKDKPIRYSAIIHTFFQISILLHEVVWILRSELNFLLLLFILHVQADVFLH